MKKIIIDTNFLLIPYQFKVDVFSEIRRICSFKYKLCIIDKTIDELKKIIKTQKGKDRKAAILALVMLDQKKLFIIKTKEGRTVDELIVENSGKDTIVATQDKILKAKLKKAGAGIIFLKSRSHLALV